VSPEQVGGACFAQWWADVAVAKSRRDEQLKELKQQRFEVTGTGRPHCDDEHAAGSRTRLQALRSLEMEREKEWKGFVGVE
jgi:hypothetical protein